MSYEMYKMNKILTKEISFKLLYVTRSTYDKGWHSTSHTHHFTELFYITKGKGAFVLPDYDVPVQQNDLVIINPHIEHTERSNVQDSLEYIALGIEGLSFWLTEENNEPIGLYRYEGEREDILFYLNKLLEEVQQSKEEYEVICQNIIEILVIKLWREPTITIEQNNTKELSKLTSFVKHYLDKNFREDITLDRLAKAGHSNKYYLSHAFKKDMGVSPIEYLNNVRIKDAKNLLETTDYSIAEIAEINGFSSLSFFSQTFKRETSFTPSAYRKKARKHETTK
ncbi:AraC family transcriptional regulator [Gracilibacillus phocaeensis]|uniref:AraC family transcriptional regulator n=1 Tax=Gracilibacillus phocaeensis TaxID=2042304 RepID=UPI0010319574|nr:AraC family transcriptional regulator [Gracilibacillus phocaeensis]